MKDLNNFLTLQLVYNQMCLNLFMDDYHFNNIASKKKKTLYLIILEKIKTCSFSINEHILYKGNNIVKDLKNNIIEFTRIVGQFNKIKL